MKCTECQSPVMHVMYMGFPGRLCTSDVCATADGWGVWFWALLPFNGMFVKYDGTVRGYWRAIWAFMSGTVPQ